jgi:PAS domain S-box-containing protein
MSGNQFCVSFENITESVQVQEQLRRYEMIVSTSNDLMSFIDKDFVYQAVNKAYEVYYGKKVEDIVGLTVRDLITDSELVELITENLKKCLKGDIVHYESEVDFVGKGKRSIDVQYRPYFNEDLVEGVVVHARDVTDKRLVETELLDKERQLRRAMKMEAVGTLAGGIAHDFNNILQIVGGNVQLMLMDAKSEKENEQYQTLITAVDRGASLVRSLLTFSRKVESILKPTNINNIITMSHKLLDRVAVGPVKIDLELVLDANIERVMADSTQIDQILTNLVLNAKDAMPDGGKIVVSTYMIDCDQLFCSSHPELEEGRHVVISVTDSGTGINKKHLERIFDPFFTTKEIGRGTGLGLAVVYGIVRNHQGYISCYSELNVGTEFKVYLPAIGKISIQKQENKNLNEVKGGNETILIIDDEKHIRELAQTIFERYGYKVICCEDGISGIESYCENRDKIDLVVLDLIMPGISGTETLQKLIEINPDIKVIVASGYSINGHAKDALNSGAMSFISKPYTIKSLLGEVRKIIDEIKENEDD